MRNDIILKKSAFRRSQAAKVKLMIKMKGIWNTSNSSVSFLLIKYLWIFLAASNKITPTRIFAK